ncbi:hypothetical protein LguiA_013774 [Lonicera macranthoides]
MRFISSSSLPKLFSVKDIHTYIIKLGFSIDLYSTTRPQIWKAGPRSLFLPLTLISYEFEASFFGQSSSDCVRMDAQAKKKAAYRAKLNAQKLGKRIESPLVRYNENDQPICRVCDVVLKSESIWPAHQASRKHHEAINNVKANAAAVTKVTSVKPESTRLPKPEHSVESHHNKPEPSTGLPKPRPSSILPSDFFDNQETKKQKTGDTNLEKRARVSAQTRAAEVFDSEKKIDALPSVNVVERESDELQFSREDVETSKTNVGSESKQVKGALPEGFFDDKSADLRARGITPVKLDVKDEYKEFEKLIQEDLKEVDNRMEEEEFDAAEMIEEAESVEQRTYRERVEMLRRKKTELKAARSMHSKGEQVVVKESSHSESSSDNDSDEDLTVDWRAKHL